MYARKNNVKRVYPTLFETIYELAKTKNRDPDKVEYLNTSINNDPMENGTTPVTMLACEGNHEAVEFLLSHGSSSDRAVTGYAAAGYLLNEKRAEQLLDSITDPEIRTRIAESAKDIVSFDIRSMVNVSSLEFKR